MSNDPRDSKRENKLNTGHRILIDIYKGEYEMRGKVNGMPLMGSGTKQFWVPCADYPKEREREKETRRRVPINNK